MRKTVSFLAVYHIRVGARILNFVRRYRRWGVIFPGCVIIACLLVPLSVEIAAFLTPFDLARLENLEVSHQIVDREGRQLRAYLGTDDRWRIPVSDHLNPWVVKATVATEDRRFWKHGGIDWIAFGRAAFSNIVHHRIVSGASTITMQVAGFTIDSRARSLDRKFLQMVRAVQIERVWSKKRILETYLTQAPYGGNVCGIEAAARRYFGISEGNLSLSQAAMLCGIPQSPEYWRPDRHSSKSLVRRGRVLDAMASDGKISADDAGRLKRLAPALRLSDGMIAAPHFCDFVHGMRPGAGVIQSTLDSGFQRVLNDALVSQVARLGPAGVTNGAGVIIGNASGEVLAMVGSVDYWSRANDGQVNAADAMRSPGSALKPLIYALGFDRHALEPSERLADVPIQFGDYVPENFDRTWHGLVAAPKALAWSLNIPALEVLRRDGINEFQQNLRSMNVDLLRPSAGDVGLSLAIGTCGVRLLDLANAYATLARAGEWIQWRVFRDDPAPAPRKVYSPDACFLVLQALSDPVLRPPEAVDPAFYNLRGVAWKTGTSNGYRDAWTFAVTKYYTVGIWLGNMNGKSSRALVGAHAAAPVALSVMKGIQKKIDPAWPVRPDGGWAKAVLCSETGMVANKDCPTTEAASVLSPVLLNQTCSVHKKIEIDVATSRTLCTRCREGRVRVTEVCSVYSGRVLAWLRQNPQVKTAPLPPEHFPGCITVAKGAPIITSPLPGSQFIITSELPVEFQKLSLQAQSPSPGTKLFWFVDGELVGTGDSDNPVRIAPSNGSHLVKVVDEFGRWDSVRFGVKTDGKTNMEHSGKSAGDS